VNPFAHVAFELLLPWQIRDRLARRPVAWIPLGTYEWHCEHLPVGLDALTAHGLCLRAADRDGGVALPALHYGTGGGHGSYPWTVMMPEPDEIAAEIDFTLQRLEDFGVKLAVIFSGHFADTQLAMIDAVAAGWNGGDNAMKVLATAVNRIEGLAIKPDHAGLFETTLLYALHPGLVQLDRLPSLAEKPLATDDWSESRHDPAHPVWGVFGPDPRALEPSAAPPLLEASVAWLVGQARQALP
jgi:creatinine amidohydrolase